MCAAVGAINTEVLAFGKREVYAKEVYERAGTEKPAVQKQAEDSCLKKTKGVASTGLSWGDKIFGEMRAITGLAGRAIKPIAGTQFIAALIAPLTISSLIDNCKKLFTAKEGRLDAGLSAIGAAADLGDGVSTVASALADTALIDPALVSFATPLMFVSAVVSAVYMVISGRALYYNRSLMKEFKEVTLTKASIQAFTKKHTYKLNTYSGVNTDLFIKTVSKIEQPKDLEKAYALLKKRVKHENISQAASIVATVVVIIAASIIFLTPWGIAASATLALFYAMRLGTMGWDLYSKKSFSQELKKLEPQPIT